MPIKTKDVVLCTAMGGLIASSIGVSFYNERARPLPEFAREFDLNKDGKIDEGECIDVIAELVDINHDGNLSEDELTKAKDRKDQFYAAGGRSNRYSGNNFSNAMDRIQQAQHTLSDWQSAVNKAKLDKEEKK